jgi:hypothetical protein
MSSACAVCAACCLAVRPAWLSTLMSPSVLVSCHSRPTAGTELSASTQQAALLVEVVSARADLLEDGSQPQGIPGLICLSARRHSG